MVAENALIPIPIHVIPFSCLHPNTLNELQQKHKKTLSLSSSSQKAAWLLCQKPSSWAANIPSEDTRSEDTLFSLYHISQ